MDRAPYKVHLEVQAVLDAFDQQASSKDLEALEVGPPYPAREVDAVERELTALLPAPMRDFLLRHGRVRAWDVATTIALPKLVAKSRSLTETLVRGKKFEPSRYPYLAPLRAGDAVAVIVGTTDAASVGYSFILASKSRRDDSQFWFFWRDEYVLEEVAADLPRMARTRSSASPSPAPPRSREAGARVSSRCPNS